MSGGSPWADPTTPTEPGPPYAGPPPTAPYGFPGYGSPYGHPVPPGYGYGYGHPPVPYGYPVAYPGPWWPAPPQAPRRPGQVITSAVLAFVQSGLVLLASLYVWFFASIVDFAATGPGGGIPGVDTQSLATEGTVLAIVQLVSAGLLIAAGIRALTRRTRRAWALLLVAHGVQVLLAVYWAVRLASLFSDIPGPDPGGVFAAYSLIFAAAPLVGLGLVLGGAGRRWFEPAAQQSSTM